MTLYVRNEGPYLIGQPIKNPRNIFKAKTLEEYLKSIPEDTRLAIVDKIKSIPKEQLGNWPKAVLDIALKIVEYGHFPEPSTHEKFGIKKETLELNLFKLLKKIGLEDKAEAID